MDTQAPPADIYRCIWLTDDAPSYEFVVDVLRDMRGIQLNVTWVERVADAMVELRREVAPPHLVIANTYWPMGNGSYNPAEEWRRQLEVEPDIEVPPLIQLHTAGPESLTAWPARTSSVDVPAESDAWLKAIREVLQG